MDSKIKTVFIGIDNGVTGSIGIIEVKGTTVSSAFIPTPVIKCRNYTIAENYLNRVDWRTLKENLPHGDHVVALLERPMVNPQRFVATESALRALESTLIVLELLNIEFSYVDSKSWQKMFLSSAMLGKEEMKEASMHVGLQLFPSNGRFIEKHQDADGLLIAEYLHRKYVDL